jgi:hypothetical protein
MSFHVEVAIGPEGTVTPKRLIRDGRQVRITEVLDQWHGRAYRYLKVKSAEGHTYILRHDEVRDLWDVTLFARKRESGPASA